MRLSSRVAGADMLTASPVNSIPPPATERLKQRRGIGIADGLDLYQHDLRLVISHFGGKHGQFANVTERELPARNGKRAGSGDRRRAGSTDRIGVRLDGMQRVCNILKR